MTSMTWSVGIQSLVKYILCCWLEYNHWSSIYCVIGWNTITGQVYIVLLVGIQSLVKYILCDWLEYNHWSSIYCVVDVGIQSLVKYILCGWLEQDCWSSVLSCRLEH